MALVQSAAAHWLVFCCSSPYYHTRAIRSAVCVHHMRYTPYLRFSVKSSLLEHPSIVPVNKHQQSETVVKFRVLRHGSPVNNSFSDNSRYSNRRHVESSDIAGVVPDSRCRVLRGTTSRNVTNGRAVGSRNTNSLLLCNNQSKSDKTYSTFRPQRRPPLPWQMGACKWLLRNPHQQQTISIISAAQTFTWSGDFIRDFHVYGKEGKSSRMSKGRIDTTGFAEPDVVSSSSSKAHGLKKDAFEEEASVAAEKYDSKNLPNNTVDASLHANSSAGVDDQSGDSVCCVRSSAWTAQNNRCKPRRCAVRNYDPAGSGCDCRQNHTITNSLRGRANETLTLYRCLERPKTLTATRKSRANEDHVSAKIELERDNTKSSSLFSKRSNVESLSCTAAECAARNSATTAASAGPPWARYVEANFALAIASDPGTLSAARQERAERVDSSAFVLKGPFDTQHPMISPDGLTLVRCDRIRDVSCTLTAAAQQQQQQEVEAIACLRSRVTRVENNKVAYAVASMHTTEGHEGEAPPILHVCSSKTVPVPSNIACKGQVPSSSLSTTLTKATNLDQRNQRTDHNPEGAIAQPQDAGGGAMKQPAYAGTDPGNWPMCNRGFDTHSDLEETGREQETEDLTECEEECGRKRDTDEQDNGTKEEEEAAGQVASPSIKEKRTAIEPGADRPYATAYTQYMASMPLFPEEEEKVECMWQLVVRDDGLCRQLERIWGFPFAVLRHPQLPRQCLRYFKQQVMLQQQQQFCTRSEEDVRNKHQVCSNVGTVPPRSLPTLRYSSSFANLPFLDGVSFSVPDYKGLKIGAPVVENGPTPPSTPSAAVLRTTAAMRGAAGCNVVPRIITGETAADQTAPGEVLAGRTTAAHEMAGPRAGQAARRLAAGINDVEGGAAAASMGRTHCISDILDGPRGAQRKRILFFILKHLRASAAERATPLTEGFAEACRLCGRSLSNSNCITRSACTHHRGGYVTREADSSRGVRTTGTTPVCSVPGNGSFSCVKPRSNTIIVDETVQINPVLSQTAAPPAAAFGGATQKNVAAGTRVAGCNPSFFATCPEFRSFSEENAFNDNPFSTEEEAGPEHMLAGAAPGGVCSDTYRTLLQLERPGMAAEECDDHDRLEIAVGLASSEARAPVLFSGFSSSQSPVTDLHSSTAAAEFRSFSPSRLDLAKAAPLLCLMRWYLAEQHADHVLQYRNLTRLADLRSPAAWYPAARALNRDIILHAGPPNSGKTAAAVQRLLQAASGCYLAPLRLLAWEIYVQLKQRGIKVSLITGQERRIEKAQNTTALGNGYAITEECWKDFQHSSADIRTGTLLCMFFLRLHADTGRDAPLLHSGSSSVEQRIRLWRDRRGSAGQYPPARRRLDPCVARITSKTVFLLETSMRERFGNMLPNDATIDVQQLQVCCEERAVPLLQKLFAQCKETCRISYYQRLAPLVVDQKPIGDLEGLRTGDCLVCFTRTDVLKLRRRLLALGFDVYAIYGQLPPAVKQRQADLFNTAVHHAYQERFTAPSTAAESPQVDYHLAENPTGATERVPAAAPPSMRAAEQPTLNGATPTIPLPLEKQAPEAEGGTRSITRRHAVLVATDAIGLGLNLHIRRVVFYRLQKYAGDSDGAARLLTAAEIRQLAGRAGRRSGVWGETGGFVSCMAGEDFERVREAIQEPLKPSKVNADCKVACKRPHLSHKPVQECASGGKLDTETLMKYIVHRRTHPHGRSCTALITRGATIKLYVYVRCCYPCAAGIAHQEHLEKAALLPSLRQLLAFCEELERQETPGGMTAAGRKKHLQSVLSSLAASQGIQAEQQGTKEEVLTIDACLDGSDSKGGRRIDRPAPPGVRVYNTPADVCECAAAATAFRRRDADASANLDNDSARRGVARTNSGSTAASSEKEQCSFLCWRGVSFSYAEAVRCFIDLLQVDPLYFVPPHKLNLMLTVVHALGDVPLPRQQLFTFCLAPLPFSSPFPFLKHIRKRNEQEQGKQQRRSKSHEQLSDASAQEGRREAVRTVSEYARPSRPQPEEAAECSVSVETNLTTLQPTSGALQAKTDAEAYRTVKADETDDERAGGSLVDVSSLDGACPLPVATLAAAGLSLLLLNALRLFAVLLATCGHVPLPAHIFAVTSEAATEALRPTTNLQQLDALIAGKRSPPAEKHLRAGHNSLEQGWMPKERRSPTITASDPTCCCSAQSGGVAAPEHTTHVHPRTAKLSKAAEQMTACIDTSCRRAVAEAHVIAYPTEGCAEGRRVLERQSSLSSVGDTAVQLRDKLCCQSSSAADAFKLLATEEAEENGKRFDERLQLLEENYQITDLYVWLARKFPAAFVDLHLALQVQQRLVAAIDAHLHRPQQQ